MFATAAVIGTGMMGAGIAATLLAAGRNFSTMALTEALAFPGARPMT
jgi:3-hydroxyacyl-CoA dehydrogenase